MDSGAVKFEGIYNFWKKLINNSFSEEVDKDIKLFIYSMICLVVIVLLVYISRRIIIFMMKGARKSNNNLIRFALKNRLPINLSLLFPYFFLELCSELFFSEFHLFFSILSPLLTIYIVLVIIWIILCVLRICIDMLMLNPSFARLPMRSYIQIATIILYLIGTIVVFSLFTHKSLGAVLAGLGALSAVTLLIFQDSIKGFVGSIQIAVNQMVEIGDWITVKNHDANGTVIDINLTTVKVRNFDNTVTMVPTYTLISSSFQNWAYMQRVGARRIMKNIFLDETKIKFLSLSELEGYKKYEYLNDYFQNLKIEPATYDAQMSQLTNCDLFMAYMLGYLKSRDDIKHHEYCFVRALDPNGYGGVPIQIYAFTVTEWVAYEAVNASVLNHAFAAVPWFGLKVFTES